MKEKYSPFCEVNVIKIDGVEYTEVSRTETGGKRYVLLADLKDPQNFMVQRLVTENGETFIEGVESRAEFERALTALLDAAKNAEMDLGRYRQMMEEAKQHEE